MRSATSPPLSAGAHPFAAPRARSSSAAKPSPATATATDSLFATVVAVLDSVKAGLIDTADVSKVREQQTRALEVSLRENGYWMANLAARVQNNEPLANMLTYSAFIRGLTAAQLQESARKYFPMDRYAKFVLLPERTVP